MCGKKRCTFSGRRFKGFWVEAEGIMEDTADLWATSYSSLCFHHPYYAASPHLSGCAFVALFTNALIFLFY